MECKDVQKKLAAYMEGAVSPNDRKDIDNHLKECQQCSQYLADLRKTLSYVDTLEQIESPTWLTKEVMKRVRTEAKPKRSILKTLFLPLHVKLPIEAAVLILVATTGVYLFKSIQPEVKLAKAPPKDGKPPVHVAEKVSEIDKSRPVPSKPTEEFVRTKEQETSARRIMQGQETTGTIAKPDELEAKKLVETKAQFISLTVQVEDFENATEKIRGILMILGGEVVKTVSLRKKRIIVARVHSEKMKELFEKLKQMGEVKQVPTTLQAWEGYSEVTIELVENSTKPYSFLSR